jgi:hypothetical protein
MKFEYDNEALAVLLTGEDIPSPHQMALTRVIIGLLEKNPEFIRAVYEQCMCSSGFLDRFTKVLEDFGAFQAINDVALYEPV